MVQPGLLDLLQHAHGLDQWQPLVRVLQLNAARLSPQVAQEMYRIQQCGSRRKKFQDIPISCGSFWCPKCHEGVVRREVQVAHRDIAPHITDRDHLSWVTILLEEDAGEEAFVRSEG